MASHVCGIYVLPFSVPFLNSPCSLIFPVLESVSFVSSGSCYIPSISCCSNINFAFFGFFNCSFSMFELISNCVFRRLQFELCNHCPIHPFFFLLFKPVLDCLLCLLCLTAWVFTIIQPIGWEFGVLADPILRGMSTLVLKWWRASCRSAVISEWSSFRALGGEMAGKRPAMGTLCIMQLRLAGTQQPSERWDVEPPWQGPLSCLRSAECCCIRWSASLKSS